MKTIEEYQSAERMPLVAARGLVLFPGMILHFDIGRKKSLLALDEAMNTKQLIYFVAQKDMNDTAPTLGQMYSTGVVAQIRQVFHLPDEGMRILVEGLYRAKVQEVIQEDPFFMVRIKKIKTRHQPDKMLEEALIRKTRVAFEQYAELSPSLPPDVLRSVASARDPGELADYIASHILFNLEDKQLVLDEARSLARLEKVLNILEKENQILRVEHQINDRVYAQMDKNQREYYLREQMRVIGRELGEEENPQEEADAYKKRILSMHLQDESEEKLLKEVGRLSKMPPSSHEAALVRTYLDTCLDLPWNIFTKARMDVAAAQKILEEDHYGMEKVKQRILEGLAVRALAPDMKGQIICLVGPPGVGKTSIAKSIAKALGRNFVRISLGGVRDEADIRGHRKTYVGAMPGRIVEVIRQAGSFNPLILLDEVDKLSHDFRGDPASALLEVLDAEQNDKFRDHYMEIPVDLSKAFFITTANVADTIPAPLYDRLEVIHLGSYTHEEKFNIAKKYLLPKQAKQHGFTPRTLRIRDDAIRTLIDEYTREAGVRSLEREIATICRKAAYKMLAGQAKSISVSEKMLEELLGPKRYRKDRSARLDETGVATGLAWTSVGGEIMPVEVAVLDGRGKIELTGSLGNVMKESARATVSYIRAHADELGVDHDFYKTKDLHVHVPEGAIPKDGPSAGITIATALVSALTGNPVKGDVAMTGEITLRGRVLPIGGLKEKTMAAYRAGMHTVIIPRDNEADLADVSPQVKEALTFVLADRFDTVLGTALRCAPFRSYEEDKIPGKEKAARSVPVIPVENDGGRIPLLTSNKGEKR